MLTSNANDAQVDVPIGKSGAQTVKKAAVALTIFQFQADDNDAPAQYLVNLSLRGGFRGKIKTDAGEEEFRLMDRNGNGVYGETMSVAPGNGTIRYGDTLRILNAEGKTKAALQLAKVVAVGKDYYTMKINNTCDKLEIARYTGELVLSE